MKPIKLMSIALVTVLFISSCNHKEYKLEDTPSDDLAAINENIISDTTGTALVTTSAKGSLWTAFEKTFKDCFEDKTFKKNIIYLGPSNSKYLGAIVSKDAQSTWKNLETVLGYNESELKKFVLPGNGAPQSCDKSELLNKYFNFVLDGNYTQAISSDLKVSLEDRRNIRLVTGKWQVDEILLGDFNKYIDTTTNQALKDYDEYLQKKGNYIITKILVIENFEAEVESNRSFSAELKAQLATGVTTQLKTNSPDSAKANVGLKFSSNSEGKINVKAIGKCYALGMVQKVSKVKS